MQRTMAASEAKKAAQKQAATGLDAMLEAMNGAKKVCLSTRCPMRCVCCRAAQPVPRSARGMTTHISRSH